MRKNRFYFLVQEYRLAQERLNEARADYIKVEAVLEVSKKLERELEDEVKKATNSNNPASIERWKNILEDCYKHDKDRPKQEIVQKIEKKYQEKEKLIAYYEKKMLVLRSLLGARQVEMLESFEEKSIMIGESHASGKGVEVLTDDEKKGPQDDGFYLSKM